VTEARLRELFEVWRSRLGLEGWRVVLEVGGVSDPTSYMECTRSPFYERAAIHVQPWMVEQGEAPGEVMFRGPHLTDDFVESSLVHELLHLHLRDLRAVVREDLDGQLHPDAFHHVERAAERAEEQAVDRLAEALVRAFAP